VTPLLAGALAERARRVVAAIEVRLAAEPPADPSLGRGAAGVALFWGYRAEVAAQEGDGEAAARAAERREAMLDAAFEAAATRPLDASLIEGFPGVAWVFEHLGEGGEDGNEEVDAAILEALAPSPWRGDHDLVSGLVGLGVYGLERALRRGRTACLARVVTRLGELAEPRRGGLAWRTPPERLPADHGAPEGYDNLGMAHGVPGVIALLAAAVEAGVEADAARALLQGAVPWLLAQDRGEGYPLWVGPGIAPRVSTQGWCHGDPGVAAALHLAGSAAQEPSWTRAALATAHRASTRGRMAYHGLCHGTAGVAHILARLGQRTGDEALTGAARAMWEGALAAEPEALAAADGPGWLDGAAGLGLALLAATSPGAPGWDRALLLSSGRNR
jgi:hypothetical protein